METKTKKLKLVETFDETPVVSLVENQTLTESNEHNSRVDGKYIIGMIEGQFFKPDGMSRNQRWYPRSLWEKALNSSDVKNRLCTSTMFGEIGHSDGPVEDMTLRNGCASHFIDDLWIDEKGRGMGRAYILNTPTGNLLKTYLGAGCKLKVSTRGEGLYKDNCFHDGCPVIDDDSYELQTADFVINPGFLETSANLRESYNNIEKDIEEKKKQIKETIAHVKKEGETRMTLDMDAYVRELKEELKAIKAENKSLQEELKAKEKELLEKQFNESAEIKKINEEFKPFKDLKVSAKTLSETLKRSQTVLKKEKAEKAKITEELEAFKAKCGSLESLDEATKLSSKALSMLQEYQKLGSAKDLAKLVENSKAILPKLAESDRLAENASKLLKKVQGYKRLEETATRAMETIKGYREVVGTLKEAKEKYGKNATNESVEKPANKAVVLKEAMQVSKKFGCTVESAAKLVKKHGMEKASKLLESALAKKATKNVKLEESKKLVEEVAQLDKVKSVPAEKTAQDFLKPGMIKNYFNQQALGKEMNTQDINDIDGTKAQKPNAVKELMKRYAGHFDTEKAPANLEKEFTPAQAEAEAKKLLK